jgi:antitoxin ParD1/3/4
MTIELKPEVEALIQRRLDSGEFLSPEEVIERALEFFAIEEDWLATNRGEIASHIQEGWDEAERGELIDGNDVRTEMAEEKKAWMQRHNRA